MTQEVAGERHNGEEGREEQRNGGGARGRTFIASSGGVRNLTKW